MKEKNQSVIIRFILAHYSKGLDGEMKATGGRENK